LGKPVFLKHKNLKIYDKHKMFKSQYNQDKFLEENVFKGYKNGFFMDIGAYDGVHINNTLYFEKTHNWTGVNVEPLETVYVKLVENRPTSINLNCAVCNRDGTAQFIYNTGYTEMLSGLQEEYDPRHHARLNHEILQMGGSTKVKTVPTKKIETICSEYNINHINYLSIDVEGAEFEVIKSINFDKIFIDVIEFENNYPDVSESIVKYLQSKNYAVICNGYDIIMIHRDSKFNSNFKA
jgi:FkbM family methyltransferase